MILIKIVVVFILAQIFAKIDLSYTFYGIQFYGIQKPSPHAWLAYFYAWDSGWYLDIVGFGWSWKAYAFFPLYPTLMKYLGLLIGDPALAGFLISNVLGVAWVPLFQNLAEQYMTRREAFTCTLLFACFPYVMIFTSAIYTESLYLFTTILAWHFYRNGKALPAGVSAGLATLSKAYGIFILIPMLADIFAKRDWKRLRVAAAPIGFLGVWMGYLYFTVGDAFAFVRSSTTLWGVQQDSVWWLISPLIRGQLGEYLARSGMYSDSVGAWGLNYGGSFSWPFAFIVILLLFGVLCLGVWELEWRLAIYSTSVLILFVVVAPILSSVRYFSFIFPLWLGWRVKKISTLFLLLPFFFIMTIVLWYQFLMGWIG